MTRADKVGLWAAALVVAAFVTFFVGRGALSYSGYCFAEHRYLSDDEFMNAAMREAGSTKFIQGTSHKDGRLFIRTITLVPYPDIAKFKATNPNCCAFVSFDDYADNVRSTSFWDQVAGLTARAVRARFQMFPEDDATPFLTTKYFMLTNCGRALDLD
ncbi:MAG: hypothetical protein J0H17_14855 [Rhizobiales bacterium]|nr:hypothetical protein [Hyphomicrobiales bacterium]